jgi:RNA 2',3'-cyclic 3'-phosphodiesterase
VDVPAGPALEALATDLRKASGSLKVVPTDRLHLTLKFLGDTEEGLVPEIVTAIREATAEVRPFELRIRGAGAFPSLGRMNVIWVGAEGAEALARIAETLEASLESLGFPRERRPWKAHVTLARVKGHRDLDRVRQILEAQRDASFGTISVDAVHLKKSVLKPEGAEYTILESVPLTG